MIETDLFILHNEELKNPNIKILKSYDLGFTVYTLYYDKKPDLDSNEEHEIIITFALNELIRQEGLFKAGSMPTISSEYINQLKKCYIEADFIPHTGKQLENLITKKGAHKLIFYFEAESKKIKNMYICDYESMIFNNSDVVSTYKFWASFAGDKKKEYKKLAKEIFYAIEIL